MSAEAVNSDPHFSRAQRLVWGLGGTSLFVWVCGSILSAGLAPRRMVPVVAAILLLTILKPFVGLSAVIALLPLGGWLQPAEGAYFVPAELVACGFFSGWLIHDAVRPQAALQVSFLGAWLVPFVGAVLSSALVEIKALSGRGFFHELLELLSLYQADAYLYPLRAALTILEGLSMLLATALTVRTRDERHRLANIFVLSSLPVSAWAAYEYFIVSHGMQVSSTLADRNSLGSYLVLVLAIGLGQWKASIVFDRAVLMPALVGLLACLYFAGSRTAWAAGAFVFAIFAWYSLRTRRRGVDWRVTLGALLITALLAGLLYQAWQRNVTRDSMYVTQRFWYILNLRNSQWETVLRKAYWLAAVDAIAAAPVLGIGIGRFYSSPYILRRFQHWEHAHNYFLQIGAELGLAGLFLWGGLLAAWFRSLSDRHSASVDEPERWTLFGLGVGMFAYLITCLTGHPLVLTEQQLLWGAAMGLGLSLTRVGPPGRQQRWWVAGWLAFLCLSVPLRHPLPSPRLHLKFGKALLCARPACLAWCARILSRGTATRIKTPA